MELLASITWVLIGGLTSYLAKQRGRDPVSWFFLGLFFGFFALLALFLMPKKVESKTNQSLSSCSPPQQPDENEIKEWFYVDKDHQQQGPIPYKELMDLWNRYTLSKDSYVWSDGMSDWRKFGDQFNK